MRKSVLLVATLAVFVLGTGRVYAVNLLTNGGFEQLGGEVPNWLLQEYVTGSLTPINAAELSVSNTTQSGLPGERHLWMRAFVGGATPGPNNLTNGILSQTVPVTVGEQYNFSGWSRFEPNFSGGVDILGTPGPMAGEPSPTVTELKLEFLDASNNLVGSPITIDVKADRIAQIGFPDPNDNSYYQHAISGAAPAGATQARVSAAAYDMVTNVGGAQSMFYDTFALATTSDPGTQLLLNPGLEVIPETGLEAWTLVTNDPGNPANVEIIRPSAGGAHGGARGVWFSSFFGELVPPGETGAPVDGLFYQTLSASPGEQYTFSGWTRWETNFSGGQDILAGGTQVWMGEPSPTQMLMEIAFLDSVGDVIGSPTQVDLKADRVAECGGNANSQTCGPAGNGWVEHSLSATAPTGTADIRVSGIMIAGVSTGGQQSAFFDDFLLEVGGASLPGDFDNDGDVDGRDFLVWQRNPSVGNLSDWQNNYGTGGLAAIGSVPEPMSSALIALGLAAGCLIRGRR